MFTFRRLLLASACAGLMFLGGPAGAKEPGMPAPASGEKAPAGPDPVMKATLEDLKLNYEIGPRGDFKLIFEVEGGRTQLLFIQSEMESYAGTDIREIWSPIMKVQGPLEAGLANQLLEDSQDRKIGGWQVVNLGGEEGQEERLVVYAIKMPDPKDPQVLYRMIQAVMLSADEMEEKLTKKDEF